MRKKHHVIASFETSEEREAELVRGEIERLLQQCGVLSPNVELDAELRGLERPVETAARSSPSMVSMDLSCDDIFPLDPDPL
jgi:hypothetical protein